MEQVINPVKRVNQKPDSRIEVMDAFDKTDWIPVAFGEVCRNLNMTERDPLANGIERYVGLEHIEPNSLHIKSWGKVADGTTFTKKFSAGHVLFGKRRAYLRKVAIADFDGVCSGDILVFQPDVDVIHPNLFPFLIQSDRFFDFAIQTSAGSLSPRTKFQDLAKFEFLLPPKEQQAKLAELLWAGDLSMSLYENLCIQLEYVKRTYFNSKFNSNGQRRKISEIAKVTSGGTPERKNSRYWYGNIPWIKTTEINYQDILSSQECITEEGVNNSAAKIIPKGSVLLAMYGQGVTRGRVAKLQIDACVNQACAAIIPFDQTGIDQNFIYYYLQAKYEEVRNLAQGANQQNLNGEMIKNIELPYPKDDVRMKINNDLGQIDESIRTANVIVERTKQMICKYINEIFS